MSEFPCTAKGLGSKIEGVAGEDRAGALIINSEL